VFLDEPTAVAGRVGYSACKIWQLETRSTVLRGPGVLRGHKMQHYSHLREAPRWGESENARARVQLRQVGDQLRQADLRHQQQRRSSWTAPVKFGKDTIKPIEEKSYQHLLFAQEQEARNKKFEEDVHFESKQVRSPTGTHSPLKVWIPPLKTERIKADGLPSALAGVDVGSLLALGHAKENISNQVLGCGWKRDSVSPGTDVLYFRVHSPVLKASPRIWLSEYITLQAGDYEIRGIDVPFREHALVKGSALGKPAVFAGQVR
jgi:hypothetical protein